MCTCTLCRSLGSGVWKFAGFGEGGCILENRVNISRGSNVVYDRVNGSCGPSRKKKTYSEKETLFPSWKKKIEGVSVEREKQASQTPSISLFFCLPCMPREEFDPSLQIISFSPRGLGIVGDVSGRGPKTQIPMTSKTKFKGHL